MHKDRGSKTQGYYLSCQIRLGLYIGSLEFLQVFLRSLVRLAPLFVLLHKQRIRAESARERGKEGEQAHPRQKALGTHARELKACKPSRHAPVLQKRLHWPPLSPAPAAGGPETSEWSQASLAYVNTSVACRDNPNV